MELILKRSIPIIIIPTNHNLGQSEIENKEKLDSLLPYYEMLQNQVNENQIEEEILFNFCKDNPLIYQYLELEEKIETIDFCNTFYLDYSLNPKRFIALKHSHDDGYDLVELYTQETINLSQFEQEKQNYIINYLRFNHSFICYATQDDLPLLMNLLEDMERKEATDIDLDCMDDDWYTKFEEQETSRLSFCRDVGLEIERAHRFDEGKPAMITQLAINYSEERIHYLLTHGENSKVCYYMQLILKNKNVEDLYLNKKDDRKYIIEAYCKLSASQDDFDIAPIRTASPIINQEVLKRKFLAK